MFPEASQLFKGLHAGECHLLFELKHAAFKRKPSEPKDSITSRGIENVAESEILEMKRLQTVRHLSSPMLYETTVS